MPPNSPIASTTSQGAGAARPRRSGLSGASRPRSLAGLLCLLVLPALPLPAQEEVNPATKPGQVQITFLPPPMEGTVSLGIFNKAGKLVRALKREAVPEKDFVVGLNGLITTWDGKNDQGSPAGPGVYSVRGYMVRAVEVSGEAFHCNDWIAEDDAPHPRAISALSALPKDRLALAVTLANGTPAQLECGLDGQVRPRKEPVAERESLGDLKEGHVAIRDGKLVAGTSEPALPELHQPNDYSSGKDGTLWLIDRSAERVEVQQYSAKGEFLRRLSVVPGDPIPEKIAASTASDLIFLLERGPGLQRVRGLALESLQAPLPAADPAPEGAPKSSTWRIVFSKSIRACDDFEAAAPYLGRPEAPKVEPTLAIKLVKNPLGKKAEATVDATVVCEPTGSFLHTADGLPLCRLTDTPGLKWAVLIHSEKGSNLLQSDGAVVEEYKLGKLNSMMPFDAGDYELK